eukprot:294178_1
MFDALAKWTQESNPTFAQLVKATQNITESENRETHNWKTIDTMSISDANWQKECFRKLQQMPSNAKLLFKLKAKIEDIDGDTFYTKNEKVHWCLKLTLTDGEDWIKAVAFEKPAILIMNGLKAEDALRMQ